MKLLSCHSLMKLKFLSEILISHMNKQQIQMWHENLLEKNIFSAKAKQLKPVRTKLKHNKHKKNPWITMGIMNSIRFWDKMYRRLRLTNCDSPMYETLEEKTLKNYNCIHQRNINVTKTFTMNLNLTSMYRIQNKLRPP